MTRDPAILESRIDAWIQEFGQQQVAAWFARAPNLLLYDARHSRQKLQQLCAVFDADPEFVMDVVRRYPVLMCSSTGAISMRVEMCSRALGIEPAAAIKLIGKAPSILTMSSSTIEERIDATAAALAVSRQSLCSMIIKQPQLLQLAPQSLSNKVASLQKILQLNQDDTASLVEKYPNLLTRSSACLASRWQRLRGIVAQNVIWSRQLGNLSNASKAACMIRSDQDIDRLQFLLHQHTVETSLVNILTCSKHNFALKHPGFEAWQQAQKAAALKA